MDKLKAAKKHAKAAKAADAERDSKRKQAVAKVVEASDSEEDEDEVIPASVVAPSTSASKGDKKRAREEEEAHGGAGGDSSEDEDSDEDDDEAEDDEDDEESGDEGDEAEAEEPTAAEGDDAKPAAPAAPALVKESFFSTADFTSLPLSKPLLDGIAEMGFTRMTRIQEKAIPAILAGKDLLGAAKYVLVCCGWSCVGVATRCPWAHAVCGTFPDRAVTLPCSLADCRTGSGKTLAFLVPIVELIGRAQFKARNGLGAVVITPTRELAGQIYSDLTEVAKHFPQKHGLVTGGANRRTEAEHLENGVNILVATPGRLLDHLQNTKGFHFANLQVCLMGVGLCGLWLVACGVGGLVLLSFQPWPVTLGACLPVLLRRCSSL